MRVDRDSDRSEHADAHEEMCAAVDSFIPRGWSGKVVVMVEAGRAVGFVSVREDVVIR